MPNRLAKVMRLLTLPLGSLMLSYFAIRLIDLTNYRPLVYILSLLAIGLPIVALAYFFQAVIKYKKQASIVSSAFLSALFWVAVSTFANGKSGDEDTESLLTNGAISLGVFTIGASVVMYIIKYAVDRVKGRQK